MGQGSVARTEGRDEKTREKRTTGRKEGREGREGGDRKEGRGGEEGMSDRVWSDDIVFDKSIATARSHVQSERHWDSL
jgi:hypothetical protein